MGYPTWLFFACQKGKSERSKQQAGVEEFPPRKLLSPIPNSFPTHANSFCVGALPSMCRAWAIRDGHLLLRRCSWACVRGICGFSPHSTDTLLLCLVISVSLGFCLNLELQIAVILLRTWGWFSTRQSGSTLAVLQGFVSFRHCPLWNYATVWLKVSFFKRAIKRGRGLTEILYSCTPSLRSLCKIPFQMLHVAQEKTVLEVVSCKRDDPCPFSTTDLFTSSGNWLQLQEYSCAFFDRDERVLWGKIPCLQTVESGSSWYLQNDETQPASGQQAFYHTSMQPWTACLWCGLECHALLSPQSLLSLLLSTVVLFFIHKVQI